MNTKVRLLLATIALAGCAGPKTVGVVSTFDATVTQRYLELGVNEVRGSALIRQRAGGVVTCAGREVGLVPVTAYSSERMAAIYGNTVKGYLPAFGGQRVKFENEPAEYTRLQKKTICDAQGYFKFDKVADGAFFVITIVTWQVSDFFYEGGALMQRVEVADGESKDIVLSP